MANSAYAICDDVCHDVVNNNQYLLKKSVYLKIKEKKKRRKKGI